MNPKPGLACELAMREQMIIITIIKKVGNQAYLGPPGAFPGHVNPTPQG